MNDKIEESSKLVNQFKRLSLSSEEAKEDKKDEFNSSSDSDLDLFMGRTKKTKVDPFDASVEQNTNNPFEFKFCSDEAKKDEIGIEKVDQQVDKQEIQREIKQEDQNNDQHDDQQSESEDDNGKELKVQFETLPSNHTYLDSDPFYNDDDVFADEQKFSVSEDDSLNKFNRRSTLEQIPEEDNTQCAEKDDLQLGEFEVVNAESLNDEIISKNIEKEAGDRNEVNDDEIVKKEDEFKVIEKEQESSVEPEKELSEKIEENQLNTEEPNQNNDASEENLSNHKEGKIEQWRKDNKEKIKLKDENELKLNDELMINAKKELEDWYSAYKADLKAKKNKNRLYEEDLVNTSKEKAKSRSWNTVVDFCDFGFKGGQKDTSRFKSVLIKIKASSNPTVE